MKLTPEQVRKIADLARLSLSEEEVGRFAGQLSSVLTHIEKLNELQTEMIEPTAHAHFVPTPLREDEPHASDVRERVLEQAPEREGDLFQVPKVIG